MSTFLAKYRYALPNLVTASFLLIAFVFGFFFLEETLDSRRYQGDPGTRFRQFLNRTSHVCKFLRPTSRICDSSIEEDPLLGEHQSSSTLSALVPPAIDGEAKPPPPRFADILTKQIILNILVYCGLSMHTISFDHIFPLLCSTNIQDGGLGMNSTQISAALSANGVMAMVLQITVYPWGHNKWGDLFCLRMALGMYAVLYFVLFGMTNLITVCSLSTSTTTQDGWIRGFLAHLGRYLARSSRKDISGVFRIPNLCDLAHTKLPISCPPRNNQWHKLCALVTVSRDWVNHCWTNVHPQSRSIETMDCMEILFGFVYHHRVDWWMVVVG
jgi:hypothetical protein